MLDLTLSRPGRKPKISGCCRRKKNDVGPDNPNGNPGPDDHPVPDKPDSHVVERPEDNVHYGREP